jgi:hypothetical protein
MNIDVNFDFQAEANGRDSDRYSPTLQEYHRLLWCKLLPNGKMFDLTKINANRLYHKSKLGEFTLSSDRAIATFSTWKRLAHIISSVPKEKLDSFVRLTDTIGGIVLWPSNKIDGLPTINAERGFNNKIVDRLDITIECIRLYYMGEASPLYETFTRYGDFFSLFGDFKGYIDFFLLQDAVSEDYSSVKIAKPFDNFRSSPIPSNIDEYAEYMGDTMRFIEDRNKRIASLY